MKIRCAKCFHHQLKKTNYQVKYISHPDFTEYFVSERASAYINYGVFSIKAQSKILLGLSYFVLLLGFKKKENL